MGHTGAPLRNDPKQFRNRATGRETNGLPLAQYSSASRGGLCKGGH